MFKKKKNHLFITCTPKSGSSYLLRLLAEILGYDIRIFIAAFDRTEQDVNEEAIINSLRKNTVTHQHTRCTKNNIRILDKHDIKPIILTRNLYDSVISMRNHIIAEPENSWWPMAYVNSDFYKLTTEKQLDFVIDLVMPWYINFYMSWYEYKAEVNNNLLWITYDELMENKLQTLQTILAYYKIDLDINDFDISKAEKAIEGKTRRTVKNELTNVILTEKQEKRLKEYAKYYEGIKSVVEFKY